MGGRVYSIGSKQTSSCIETGIIKTCDGSIEKTSVVKVFCFVYRVMGTFKIVGYKVGSLFVC